MHAAVLSVDKHQQESMADRDTDPPSVMCSLCDLIQCPIWTYASYGHRDSPCTTVQTYHAEQLMNIASLKASMLHSMAQAGAGVDLPGLLASPAPRTPAGMQTAAP